MAKELYEQQQEELEYMTASEEMGQQPSIWSPKVLWQDLKQFVEGLWDLFCILVVILGYVVFPIVAPFLFGTTE